MKTKLRKRVQIKFTEKCITDQAAAKDLTMASIVKKLEKGIMPRLTDNAIYSTDLGVRNLQDLVERQNQVKDLFYQLPTEIRSAMKNDIKNFEPFISDPKNQEILLKNGLMTQKRNEHLELIHAIKELKLPNLPKKPSPEPQNEA